MVKLGFNSYVSQGPGIFLCRLQRELEHRGLFSETEPDVWIQLPFQELPLSIAQRVKKGQTQVIVRMNGCYCQRHFTLRKPFTIPLPILDTLRSKRVNARKNAKILTNLLHADGIIYQSDFSKRLTERFVLIKNSKRTVETIPNSIVYNGVPLDVFSPKGPIRTELTGQLNMLVSHSFRPYHRLHDSMRILSEVKRKLTDTRPHLHILGSDDDSGSFNHARNTAEKLGLIENKDYTFWGKLPFDELGELYRSCDLMLNLSYWDSCPNVVIEALASGLPVVGVNHGGVAELVGHSGVLINETIPFTYIDHMSYHHMPKAPISRYVMGVEEVFLKRKLYEEKALHRAETFYDIKKICDDYLAVATALV